MEISPAELGKRIKQERLKKNLTLKEIESKVGISATHVSEIERGRTSPTVGALSKIALALDTKMALLVDVRTPPPITQSTSKDRAPYQLRAGNVVAEPLFPFHPGPEVSLFLLAVPVGEKNGAFLKAAMGEVILLNMKGLVEVCAGGQRQILRDGDVLHFISNAGDSLENIGESEARLFAAVSPRMSI